MIPDAIIIFSGGIVVDEKEGQNHWRTTTYEERDAFGTLGGRDRVEAAVLLAKKYSNAYLVTTSHTLGRIDPSLAKVYASELHTLGVEPGRIMQEERSSTTQTAVAEALRLAQEKGWKHIILLSSEFHLPRVVAFYEQTKNDIEATAISSESVLTKENPAFAEYFEKMKKSPAYQKRLVAERRGLKAIKKDTYRPAQSKDKQERSV